MKVVHKQSGKPIPARSRSAAVEILAPLVSVVEMEEEGEEGEEDGEGVFEDTERQKSTVSEY
jgi:hypothetical protein